MAENNGITADLSAAWDKLAARDGDEGGEAQEAEAQPEADAEGAATADSAPDGEVPPDAEAQSETTEARAEQRPAPQKLSKSAKTGAEKAPQAQQPTATGPKAPQAWPVAVRAQWEKLPPEVKEHVDKREREVKRALEISAQARRTADELERTIAPYKPLMRGTPLQEIDGLFKTAALLRTGDEDTRAAITANIIKNFGVSVKKLAIMLGAPEEAPAGEPAQAEGNQPQPRPEIKDPRVDALIGALQQRSQASKQARQQEQEREKRRHIEEMERFAESGKAEYFWDVLPQMEVVQAAAQRDGETLSLEEVYERACFLNANVRPLWEQRRAATQAAANASRASTQPRTRVATSSARHEPTAPATGGKELSRSELLSANWDKLVNRR